MGDENENKKEKKKKEAKKGEREGVNREGEGEEDKRPDVRADSQGMGLSEVSLLSRDLWPVTCVVVWVRELCPVTCCVVGTVSRDLCCAYCVP